MSFLALLIGQDLDALEYWKASIALVCSSKACWEAEASAGEESTVGDVRIDLSLLEGFIRKCY